MTTRILPNALHFSEFQGGFHGTCGETALATAMVCSTPPIEDTQEAIDLMLSMTHELIGLGWASSSGSTTTQHLRDEAVRRGFSPDSSSFISFQQPLANSAAFHNLLLSTAGVKPIIIEIARAGVLEGNAVQYHFICIVGITDAGYICNDGDNPNITSHLVTYSWAQIEAAVPCGVLVLEMKTSGGSAMPVPAGWHDNGSTLTDPTGKAVMHGFRQYILDHAWDANDLVVSGDMGVDEVELANTSHGKGDVQFFRYSQLSYTAKEGVFKTWLGSEAAYMRGQISAQNDEITSLQQQVAALNAQIAALKSQPATTVDPSVKTALSAAANLLQPYGTALSDVQNAIKTLP